VTMQVHEKYLRYIHSSRPLEGKDFDELSNHNGIFKQNFFDNPIRKPIIEEFKRSIQTSQGGVFLVSGYRGTGKTTFLNYVLDQLIKENHNQIINNTFNLSSIDFKLKFEIMCRIIFILHDCRNQFHHSIRKDIDAIYRDILWERTKGYKISGQIGNKNSSLQTEQQLTLRQKDNIIYLDSALQDLLKRIKINENKNIVLILDELDKVPVSITDIELEQQKDQNNGQNNTSKIKRMDWLLKMLSDIKYFLFESGIIFILVVNKDVFDYWRTQHSVEDLFMNLVTNAFYIPGYFQEEMELHHDFQITLNEDVGRFTSYSPYAVKKYFQKCAYYESYANPRLFFQHLSRKMINNQITITENDADYLYHKVRLYQFNELIYDYFYDNKEINFRYFLAAIEELYIIFQRIEPKSKKVFPLNPPQNEITYEITEFFRGYFNAISTKINPWEFWSITRHKADTENFLYKQLETFIILIKEIDQLDHYPATNYIIRRLIDFTKIIWERHLISAQYIIDNMHFELYELNDVTCQYLVLLLIPMNIIFLKNTKVIEINGSFISYKYQTDNNMEFFHQACHDELVGNLTSAYTNYIEYINKDFNSMDAMNRILRLFIYMITFGYTNQEIDIKFEWENILNKMDQYFLDKKESNINYFERANFLFNCFLYNNFLLDRNEDKDKKFKPKSPFCGGEPGQNENIIGLYNKAIDENPIDATLHLHKGFYLYWSEQFIAALDAYNQAASYNNDPIISIFKGQAYIQLEIYGEAVKSCREAMNSSTCWLHKALILSNIIWLKYSSISNKKPFNSKCISELNKILYELTPQIMDIDAKNNLVIMELIYHWINKHLFNNPTTHSQNIQKMEQNYRQFHAQFEEFYKFLLIPKTDVIF
jgi:hypothetical protein